MPNCPFCGGEAEVAYSNDNHKQPYIRCKFGVMENPKCPASNMYQWQFRSLDEAIKSWNTRTPMDNIVEKLEEKTEFLKDCTKYGNESAEQQEKSYSTIMMYEVADLVADLIDIVKQEINNGLE